jgi:flagellar hook-associated protein 1 FlgK
VTPPGGTVGAPVTPGGETGAVAQLLNTTLPDYRTELGKVAQQLADDVNAQHQAGFGGDGVGNRDLFSYDPADPSGTLSVAITLPEHVAASGISGAANLDGGNATDVADTLAAAESAYQRLVNGFGTEVASTRRLALNQQTLTNQVDGAREQLSGVNLDEEMVTMLQAQRAYEAAARVMTTIDSVLDTLINRTGLVR